MAYESPKIELIEWCGDVIRTSTPFVDADDWLDQG